MPHPLFLGIEIGGTKLQLGLGRGDGTLVDLERRRVDPEAGGEGIRSQIVESAGVLARRQAVAPVAVGFGFGGPVDAEGGIVTVSNQISGWAGFPIVAWAREALGVPRVVLQNDADTAALGEAKFGAGVGHDPVLYVTIGSGIGGGLVIDGVIYRGAGRGAVEIGHLIVGEGETTLEAIASGWSIAREARNGIDKARGGPLHRLCKGDPSLVTTELVARAATEGDEVARLALAKATQAMGRALAHAMTLLAPGRIILGGGVSLMGDELWFEPIRTEVASRVFPPFRGTYEIVPAALGEEVVVHGALALAAEALRQ